MAKKSVQQSSEFHVVLQGLKLEPDVEKRIEMEIRKAVLKELAQIDLKGELDISPLEKFPSLTTPEALAAPGHTAGIAVRAV
jgi:hypothetical protein